MEEEKGETERSFVLEKYEYKARKETRADGDQGAKLVPIFLTVILAEEDSICITHLTALILRFILLYGR